MKAVAFCALVVILLLTAACGSGEGDSNEFSGELLVAAAYDLKPAFEELGAIFQEEAAAKVTFSFGSSGLLAQQIEGGLPADIYVAADIQHVERLREKGLIIGDTQQVYAVGRLALATSTKAGLALSDLGDLTRSEVKQVAIANPEHAPYGRAAEEALRSAGLWEQIRPKLVYGENVGQVIEYLQSGNAEAGLVALSLVIGGTSGLSYVVVDEGLHQPIRQALAVLKETEAEPLARRFVAFIRGSQGRVVLEKYGFVVAEEG